MTARPVYRKLFAFLAALLLTTLFVGGHASANELLIFDGKLNKSNVEALDIKLFFTLRDDATAKPIKGLEGGDVSVTFNGKAADLDSKSLKDFRDAEEPVAFMFVFPVTNSYDESEWQIRENVAAKIEAFVRPIDFVGAIGYDSKSKHTIKPAQTNNAAGVKNLAKRIKNWEQSEEPQPHLYNALNNGLRLLEEVEDAKLKYLVVISDAEGAITDTPKAAGAIAKFRDRVAGMEVTPIILAYFFDGEEGRFFPKLEEMGAAPGAVYYKAEKPEELDTTLNEALDDIYTHYILAAVLKPEQGGEWVEAGKHKFGVKADKDGEAEGDIQMGVHELDKSYMWILWLILGILGGFLLIFIIIKIVKRKPPEEEHHEIIDDTPQSYNCQTCGRTIPEELYGFQGEFCIEGGRPDCPYYQMPDRGRLVISRGPLAGVTFFIKEEVTTIGRQDGCQVMLKDGSVSRRHAAIKVDEGMRYELRDFDSASGTFCNGEKVSRKFLRDGDKLSFGTVEVEFRLK